MPKQKRVPLNPAAETFSSALLVNDAHEREAWLALAKAQLMHQYADERSYPRPQRVVDEERLLEHRTETTDFPNYPEIADLVKRMWTARLEAFSLRTTALQYMARASAYQEAATAFEAVGDAWKQVAYARAGDFPVLEIEWGDDRLETSWDKPEDIWED